MGFLHGVREKRQDKRGNSHGMPPPIGKALENIDRAGRGWKDNIESRLDPKDVLNGHNVGLATGSNLPDQQVTIGLDETRQKTPNKRKEPYWSRHELF
jgi:hypothetical protein